MDLKCLFKIGMELYAAMPSQPLVHKSDPYNVSRQNNVSEGVAPHLNTNTSAIKDNQQFIRSIFPANKKRKIYYTGHKNLINHTTNYTKCRTRSIYALLVDKVV